jgi:PPOX class F420-dependent enzyme/OxyR family protein
MSEKPTPTFTPEELAFINEQKFARYATATPDGKPHVVPGRAFVEDGKVIIPGWEMKRSYKFAQVKKNPWVAVVWDVRDPRNNQGVEVRGRAEAVEDPNNPDDSFQYRIEVTPTKVFSWGIHEHYGESFEKKMGYPPHPVRPLPLEAEALAQEEAAKARA